MKSKILKLGSFLLLSIGLTGIQAQEVLQTAGGNYTGSGGSVSNSIGQIVYTTNKGANGSVAQGVQQPFEISVITVYKEAKYISLNCSVYPNPATDYLLLKIDGEIQSNYVAYLYDINGKLIINMKVENNETRIDMSHLLPATYFLKVTDNEKELKAFKIIKY
jgi:hypothetical protein